MNAARALAAALALLAALAPEAAAVDARLAARFEPAVAAEIDRIVQDATRAWLPAEPLVATALEGASRGVPAPRIVEAVRRQADALARARAALGPRAGTAALVAGASVLRAGVPADTLKLFGRTRRDESYVIPLVVVADLVARGVPPGTAATSVLSATRAGARDADLLRVRGSVSLDIQAGASPTESAVLRTRTLLLERAGQAPPPGSSLPRARPLPRGTGTSRSLELGAEWNPRAEGTRLRLANLGTRLSLADVSLWLGADARLDLARPGGGLTRVAPELAIGIVRPGHALWSGVALEAARERDWETAQPSLRAGASLQRGGFELTARLENAGRFAIRQRAPLLVTEWIQLPDTLLAVSHWEPRSPQEFLVRATGVEAGARWARGRVELSLLAGVRGSARRGPEVWAGLGTTWRPRPGWALLLAGRSGTGTPLASDAPDGRGVSLGVRFEPGRVRGKARPPVVAPALDAPPPAPRSAAAWRTHPGAAGGRIAFELWAPDAASVELRGDFTGWDAVALTKVGSGWWRVELVIPAGIHGLAIRVDGGDWSPPPGTPAAPGEFGDLEGVLVVP